MRLAASLMLVALAAAQAPAVAPETWDHKSEADFADGKFESTAVSSLGEIRLARKIVILMSAEDAPEVISAVAQVGGHIYAGSGVEPVVYRVTSGKPDELARLDGAMITSLATTDGKLLAAAGGDEGGIYEISSAGNVRKLWSDDQVKYVWAMLPVGTDKQFAATGPEGKVYLLRGLGKKVEAETLYEAGELAKNILCLALSRANGMLYAGTDTEGLVVEINPVQKTSRVVLDADESEIAALQIDPAGGIFAATSDAAKAQGDGASKPNSAKAGKAVPAEKTEPAPEPDQADDQPEAPEKQKGGTEGSFTQVDIDEMVELMGSGEADQPAVKLEWQEVAAIEQDVDEQETPEGRPTTMPTEVSDEDSDQSDTEALDEPDKPEPEKKEEKPSAAPDVSKPKKRPPAKKGKGNAVYYIRPDGLVETRFRRPVTILAMLLEDDRLYLATGNGGAIYSVSVDGDEVVKLADTEAAQVTAMVIGPDDRIIFATANKGSVGALSSELAESGNFASEALDAEQIARWGTVRLWSQLPPGTSATVATRSGNVKEPDDATWGSWSKEQPANGGFLSVGSPTARFLQYRLTLTGDGKASPAVQHVRIIYQVGNLAPSVTAVTVTPKDKGNKNVTAGGAQAFREIAIKADDPNGDKLSYEILFREAGAACWVSLTKDLTKPKYIWDTRTVADGDYETLVKASDSPANPPATALTGRRISDLVLVDNTAPLITELGAAVGDRKVTVQCSATDAGSRITAAHYAVDSQEKWTVLAAADGMYDSDSESFRFELTELEPGPHRIAVKVADLYGNVAYKSVAVTLGK